MFARLANNTMITGVSFVITGVVPLLLVPILVHQYGMLQYGILVLARLLLPTGALAFFDVGNSETAAYAVARARHNGDWGVCRRLLAGLLRLNICLALVAGVLMYLLAPWMSRFFGVEPAERQGFEAIVRVTALAMPLLMASLAAEGVMRGFEAFRSLRAIDVGSTFVFAGLAFACVEVGLGFAWVGIAYVAYAVLRATLLLWASAQRLPRRVAPNAPGLAEWSELRARCIPLAANRLIGVGQAHAAPMLIGALIGPTAVGFYDIVVRIPRFLKIVTGALNTAVLPLVMRLDQANDKESVRRLFDLGLLSVLCIVAPVAFWSITFSDAILRLWVSPAFERLWPWQALMFLWPLLNSVTSFTCGALLARPDFVRSLNWIVLGQIIVQVAISLAAMHFFSEQGFVLGQIAALFLSFPLQMALVFRHSGVRAATFKRHGLLITGLALATALALLSHLTVHVANTGLLVASLVVWTTTAFILIWLTLVTPTERATIKGAILGRLRRRH
jgi:O-antigen/teichoic acid export membrane protein